MAILDRPMFRRPLTKDELRAYGIPAFANGGVVRKFEKGGKVDLGYTESGAISSKPMFNPFKGLSREDYDRMSAEEVLNYYYQVDQTRVPGGIREAESVDRLYNILRKSGPDLPGFMEELRKPKMTQPITGMEFQETAIKQLSEEQQKEAKKELVKSDIKNVEDEISLIEETIKYKKDNNLDTSEDEKLLKDKKDQLNLLESTTKSTVDIATIDEEEKKRLAARARDTKVKEEQEAVAEGQETLAAAGLGATGGERERLVNLEKLVQERSELYKKIIGDPKEALKQQGFLQLAQFGLNLAAARGGNLAEKIARSAADPLQSFAALAQQAMKDERAIDLLAIEAGEEELARAEKEDDKAGALGQVAEAFKIAEPGKSQAYYMNKAIDFSKAKSGQSQEEITASLAETVYKTKSAADPDYSLSDAFAEVGATLGISPAASQGEGSEWDSIEIGGVFTGDDGKKYRKTGSAYIAENIELIG